MGVQQKQIALNDNFVKPPDIENDKEFWAFIEANRKTVFFRKNIIPCSEVRSVETSGRSGKKARNCPGWN